MGDNDDLGLEEVEYASTDELKESQEYEEAVEEVEEVNYARPKKSLVRDIKYKASETVKNIPRQATEKVKQYIPPRRTEKQRRAENKEYYTKMSPVFAKNPYYYTPKVHKVKKKAKNTMTAPPARGLSDVFLALPPRRPSVAEVYYRQKPSHSTSGSHISFPKGSPSWGIGRQTGGFKFNWGALTKPKR